MFKLVQPLLLLSVTLLITACPDNGDNKKSRINRYRAGQNFNGNNPITNPGAGPGMNVGQQNLNFRYAWGDIIESSQQTDGFQAEVYGFFSAADNPYNVVGAISGQPGQNTGLFYFGKVQTQNTQPVSGHVYILPYDSNVANGQRQAKYYGFELTSGNIQLQGSTGTATLTFSDGAGTFQMQGQFDLNGGLYQGTIVYQNEKYWDGETPGHSGVLGTFRVPACGFFTCNN